MEQSEIQQKAITLGKALVKELDLEEGVDTLSKWMGHYIAEQIAKIENSEGKEKEEAKQKCFETILKLWERRVYFPEGKRPFEEFAPIFRALERLDIEKDNLTYYKLEDLKKVIGSPATTNDLETWINYIINLDKGTKQIIRYCLSKAYENSNNEQTKEWIENSKSTLAGDDIKAIRIISGLYNNSDNETDLEVERLRSLLNVISSLEKTQNDIKSNIKARIKELN